MYLEEERYRDKQERRNKISNYSNRGMSTESDIRQGGSTGFFREFFNSNTSFKIYPLIIKLIIRYPEAEYIKHTKKLAYILMKIILRDQQKDNF